MYYLLDNRTNQIVAAFERELDAWAELCVRTDCHMVGPY